MNNEKQNLETILDLDTRELFPRYKTRCIRYSPQGDYLLVGFRDGSVKLYVNL